ncbi:MAG: acyl--CoA ligase [Bacteroidales bacterium]|nr:acyl--CoA ligase [Candidatus Cryptobacteroides equifaecalis]
MSKYFYDMLPAEEFAQLKYFPTTAEFVQWIGEKWADRVAVSNLTESYTYAQMCERIARRRAFLYAQGLKKGDKVAIFERNSIDAVEMFLAVTSAGFVAINLPSMLPAPAVAGSCKKFDVSLLVVRDEFKEMVAELPVKMVPSSSMAEEGAPVAEIDKEESAAIFFTGGTTGAPKGAVLPHRALMRGSYNACFAPGSQMGGERFVGLLPLSHVFGLIFSTMGCFYTGGTWFAAEDMKATISKLPVIKPTKLVLVPGLCDVLVGLAKMYGPQFLGGSLKLIITGAALVPPRLAVEFEKMGIKLCAGYGMTEGANLTSACVETTEKPDSVGKIYPGIETKVVDGELWFRGDNTFTGYYNDPENTAATLTEDGWVKTGDLVRFDEEGYLYITGRIKNLIILSNGENISPEVIEEHFYKVPTVKDCLVSEKVVDGEGVIAIEILPNMPAFEGKSWEDVEAYFNKLVNDINATLPSVQRVSKLTVRREDFKRTGSLKVARNQ